MSSILYGNLRVEILPDLGGRLERISLQVMPLRRAGTPDPSARSPYLPLLGRDDELSWIQRALHAHQPIELIAPCGFGKTALLRRLAGTDDTATRPQMFLQLRGERLDDILQQVFQASYTSPQRYKPTPQERTQLLGRLTWLVLLDDVDLPPQDVERLLDELSNCSLVLGATRPLLGRHGTSLQLPGLRDRAAVTLLTRDLGRSLTPEE